jgi:hypothetical protein
MTRWRRVPLELDDGAGDGDGSLDVDPEGVATMGTWADDDTWRLGVVTIGPGPAELEAGGVLLCTWLEDWLCDVDELGCVDDVDGVGLVGVGLGAGVVGGGGVLETGGVLVGGVLVGGGEFPAPQLSDISLEVTTDPSTPMTRTSYAVSVAAGAAMSTLSLPGPSKRISSPCLGAMSAASSVRTSSTV